jgi:uncharacterized caspase-like protein
MRKLFLISSIVFITSWAYGQTDSGKDWALVVGIDRYQSLPGLTGAVKGARLLAQKLVKDFGFKESNIIELYDDDATRSNVLNAFDKLTDQQNISKNDRVFIFFAGHAVTKPVGGKDVGFLMPTDGVMEKFFGTAISTDQLQVIEQASPAKQVFFCMDACYGGTIFTRGLGLVLPKETESGSSQAYTAKQSRSALTAGSKDEEVTDIADQGIDAFTYYLLQGLSGAADVNADNLITSSELADYVAKSVRYRTTQHPQYGKLPGDDGGEFVFLKSTPASAETAAPAPPAQTQKAVNENPQQQVAEEEPSQPPRVVHPSRVIQERPEAKPFWVYAFLGGNSNSYSMNLNVANFTTKSGGDFGIGAEYRITPNLALGLNLFVLDNKAGGGTWTPGAAFYEDNYFDGGYYDEVEVVNGTFTEDIRYFSINPLIKLSLGGAYIDLGPSIGIVTKAEETGNRNEYLYDSDGYYPEVEVNVDYDSKLTDVKTRVGLPIGVGYDLSLGGFRLSCELRYDLGLTDLYSNTSGKISSVQFLFGAGIGL